MAKIHLYLPVDTVFIHNETRLCGPRLNGAQAALVCTVRLWDRRPLP